MVCTPYIGAATSSGALAYAKYVVAAALETQKAADYYVGDIQGRDVPEPSLVLRPDLSPEFAKVLGIDQSRSLTLTEFANLMNIKTADGEEIEGRKKHSAHQSVASVFGLSTEAGAKLPTVEEIENVLAGLRADGSAPRAEPKAEPALPAPAESTPSGEQHQPGTAPTVSPPDLSEEQREEPTLAHLEAWFSGTDAPDLAKLADVAIAAAEQAERGNPGLSDEARALHGLSQPEAEASHLAGVPLADLRDRRETVGDHWTEAWLQADYHADVMASGRFPDDAPSLADVPAQQPDAAWLASFDESPPAIDTSDDAELAEPASKQAGPGRLSEKRVESAVRAFKAAVGLPAGRDATVEEIQRVADGHINIVDYRKKIAETAPAVGYVDLTFSSDKTVSSAWALAPTDAERAIILECVNGGIDDAMAYAETVLGLARRGAGGKGEREAAELAWAGIQHYTARPVTDVVRLDAEGREYTQPMTLPTDDADVNLHQHRIVFSSIRTKEGHIGAIDLSPLQGEKKVMGAIFHAGSATRLRAHGVDVVLGPHGEARITGFSEAFRKFASRRSTQGEDYAREWAKAQGRDWDALSPDMKVKLIEEGVAERRQAKSKTERRNADEADPNIARWQAEAKAFGYNHRSVLQPGRHAPKLTEKQRIEIARDVALKLLDKEFQKNAVLLEGKVKEVSARGLVVAGLGSSGAADVAAIVASFRERGIVVNGEKTDLARMVDVGDDGRRRVRYTTGQGVALEEKVIALVREAAADKSRALTPEQIDAAAVRFLAKNPKIDPTGPQWIAQREMQHAIGQGGRLSLSVGVAGSGKTSSVIGPLVDAWHKDGRQVIGMTVPWKASGELRKAGVDQALAIDAFLNRVAKGKIVVDRNTVIVADEVSQIGIVHQAALLKLASETGAQLVEIGDPKQCLSVSTPGIDLMMRTIGDENIAKILTTIRQQDERDREIATMFRSGHAEDGIAALTKRDRFHLIPGGEGPTIAHTVKLWRQLTDANKADPDYTLLVIAPTNGSVQKIGNAIREDRRAAGEIGQADTVLKARDPNSGATFDLPVTSGDKLRLFSRTYDADTPGRQKSLSSNGDVVEVREVLPDGLRIRNEEGVEGRLTWAQLKPWRAPKNDPIMATYGHVLTADTSQSLTRSNAIEVMAEGSAQLSANKNYVGMTRQTGEVHMVVSESHERAAIVRRQMLGMADTPSREDVIRNIAANLSRFTVKEGATEALRRAFTVERGAVSEMRMGAMAEERRRKNPGGIERPGVFETIRMTPVVDKTVEIARQLAEQIQQVAQWQKPPQVRRGPRMRR